MNQKTSHFQPIPNVPSTNQKSAKNSLFLPLRGQFKPLKQLFGSLKMKQERNGKKVYALFSWSLHPQSKHELTLH